MALEMRAILSLDTSCDAEALQVETWRSLSTVEIADLIRGASRAARLLAMAGLRDRHPHLSDDDLVPQFALLTLGLPLAQRVYPDLIVIEPSSHS